MLSCICFWHRAVVKAAFCNHNILALTECLLQHSLLPRESRLLTSSRAHMYGCSWVCSCSHFALLYEAKTLSCAVMQEWHKLGAEYIASKHYAKSLHRLAAVLQVLHRLSVVSACTAMLGYLYGTSYYLSPIITLFNPNCSVPIKVI